MSNFCHTLCMFYMIQILNSGGWCFSVISWKQLKFFRFVWGVHYLVGHLCEEGSTTDLNFQITVDTTYDEWGSLNYCQWGPVTSSLCCLIFFVFFCFVLSCYQLTACRVMLLLVVPVLLFMPFLEFLKGQKECSVLHS